MQDLRRAFPSQENDEVVYVFARPFFLAFVPTILLFLIAFFFAVGIQYVVAHNILFETDPYIANAIVLLIGVFELGFLVIFLVAIFDFYYDIFIVTNQRIVDIDQEQLFSRPISELNLVDIEDVKSDVTGVFPTIFNYGQVQIQTAGEQENFIAEDLRFPREITSIVADLSQQAKEDIEQGVRVPRSVAKGVINDKVMGSLSDLKDAGALLSDDVRRLSSNRES